jgi:hypothetical protein
MSCGNSIALYHIIPLDLNHPDYDGREYKINIE